MRALRVWISAFAVYLLLAFYYVPDSYRSIREGNQPPQTLVGKLKERLLGRAALGTFTIWDPVTGDMEDVLYTGEAFYPASRPSPVFRHFLRLDCGRGHPGGLDDAETKALRWVDYKCGRSSLPRSFFKTPPYNHPQGGSWVWYAHRAEKEFSSREWLDLHRSYLTVIELASIIESREAKPLWKEIVLSLSPGELMPLQEEWERFVVTNRFVFVRAEEERNDFRVFPAGDFRELLRSSVLDFKALGDTDCVVSEGSAGCWAMNRGKLNRAGNILTAFIGGLIALLSLMIFHLWRSRARLLARTAADRLLMVQTLTHELRHPVTGLRLSMETFRDRYDDLAEPLRDEFLRMTQQMQRLQRLIFASEQYLQNDKRDQLFSFKKVSVESFNQFMEDLLEPYHGKLEIGLLARDRAAFIDPYWLGMCIANLTKNALMHGKKPIRVECSDEGSSIAVSVIDSGQGLAGGKLGPIGQMRKGANSSGMGLGLHLVRRIVQMMGGEVSYRHTPRPTFTLRMSTDMKTETYDENDSSR